MRGTVAAVGLAVVLAVLATAGLARAEERPLPASEWSKETRLLLAQAMVAEAGFQSQADHVAIAYVLKARWLMWDRSVVTRNLSFTAMIRAYCSGIGRWVPERLSARLRWIKALSDPQIGKPKGWPKEYGKWEGKHADLWVATLDRAEAWAQGQLSDPCKGRAKLWGGVGDPIPPRGWSKVECGKTANTFYGLKRRPRDRRVQQTGANSIERVATR